MMGFVSLISVINTVTATGIRNELTLHTGETDLAHIKQQKCPGTWHSKELYGQNYVAIFPPANISPGAYINKCSVLTSVNIEIYQ